LGSANQDILGNVYQRSNLSRKVQSTKPVRDEYGVSVIVVASVMTVAVTVAVTIVIVIWESMLYLLKLVTACYTIMTTAAAERQYSCSIAHRARALAT